MKKLIISVLLFAVVMPAIGRQVAPNFTLKGIIKGQKGSFVKLSYTNAKGEFVQDSCAIVDGAFQFKGQVAEPTMADISGAVKSFDYDDPNLASFYLEPGLLMITLTAGDFKHFKLTGSKTQNEWNELEKSKSALTKALAPVSKGFEEANANYIQAMKDNKSEAELDLAFIKSHINSYHAAYLLQYKVASMPLDSGKKYYANLSSAVKNSSYGKAIVKEIESLQSGSPGSKAKMFTVKDINGVELNLAELNSRNYVLLDFWASWCVPCRKGNPHLLSLYSKYKDKGLEIIGISDDDGNPAAWRTAVQKDNIAVWRHVLRGIRRTAKGYDRSADLNDSYGIQSLPTKILIDREGVIVGRYGGGGESDEAMDQKLAEIFGNAGADAETTVSGKLTGLKEDLLVFYYRVGDQMVSDSVKVTDERFVWAPGISRPQKVATMLLNSYFQFYVEPGNMSLTGDSTTASLKVAGSKTQDEYDAFLRSQKDLDELEKTLYENWGKVTKEAQIALETKAQELKEERSARNEQYIEAHPKSLISLDLLTDIARMGAYDKIQAAYWKLDKSLQQSIEGKRIAERLVFLKRSSVGTPMLDFTQNDPNGKPVRFASFKGKYVLVDFWASWCEPCRAENPNVLKAYNQYKDKNFTVLGISLDTKSENWKKAIKDDNMPWTQVSDLKGFRNEVSTYYGITGIPSTLLIDPLGKIIAKNLRGEALNEKLAELFKVK